MEQIDRHFQNFDIEYCRNYILEYRAKDYQEVKARVDLMMKHTFVFADNWDMEPCQIPYHIEPLVWDKLITDDPEWNYMLNRQTYLLKFILVYLVEEDERYLIKLKDFIFHWIDSELPLKTDSLATRTLDTGIRCMTWLKILLFLHHFQAISVEEHQKILISLRNQLQFLKDSYIDKYSLSNWGILQTTAILSCAAFFGEELQLPEVVAFAEQELMEQLRLQILEDGSQYEQSTMYHVEVYKALADLVVLVPSYREKLHETLVKMADYVLMMTGPDHCQLAVGDSDVTDTRDVMTLSTILLQSSEYKSFAFDDVDLDSILLFGKKGIEEFKALPAFPIVTKARHFSSSGQVCIRDERRYLFFKNGPLGSSHSHSDQNSFCLYDKGKPIFIDSGRYTYKEEELRYELKKASHHSTCLVEDIEAEQVTGSWSYGRYPQADVCSLIQEGEFSLVEGICHVQQEEEAYHHKRWVITLPHAITLIFDKVDCSGHHYLTTQFILDEQVEIGAQTFNDLRLISPVAFEMPPILISKKYNELTETKKLFKRQPFDNRIFDYSLLVDKDARVDKLPVLQTGSQKELQDAFAWEIRGKGYHYLLGVLPDDILKGDKLYTIDGIKCKGKVVIYDKKNDKFRRLKN